MFMVCLFGIFTPLGVSLGIILGETDSDNLELICASLAGGTFIYIACSEVIVEEFSLSRYRFSKMAFFCFGILIIGSLKFLEDPEESCFLPENCTAWEIE